MPTNPMGASLGSVIRVSAQGDAKPFSVGSVHRSVTQARLKRQLTKTPKQGVLDTTRLFDLQDSVLEID